jgi:cystathionine beta-synthase
MRMYDISQLPVLQDRKIVGILDESDLLLAVTDNEDAFQHLVSEFMTTKLQTVSPRARLDELLPIFDAGLVAIVADGEEFFGLITRVDILSFLRRRHKAA